MAGCCNSLCVTFKCANVKKKLSQKDNIRFKLTLYYYHIVYVANSTFAVSKWEEITRTLNYHTPPLMPCPNIWKSVDLSSVLSSFFLISPKQQGNKKTFLSTSRPIAMIFNKETIYWFSGNYTTLKQCTAAQLITRSSASFRKKKMEKYIALWCGAHCTEQSNRDNNTVLRTWKKNPLKGITGYGCHRFLPVMIAYLTSDFEAVSFWSKPFRQIAFMIKPQNRVFITIFFFSLLG